MLVSEYSTDRLVEFPYLYYR